MTAFADAGFRIKCFHPHPRWGFLSAPGAGKVSNSQDPAAIVSALASWGDEDLFVVLHHWWTHLPYVTHALEIDQWHRACDFSLESLGRYPGRIAPKLRQSYHRAVEHFSEELLGRYLDAAGKGGRDVLLVVTGDHGENWGESLPPGRRVENVYDLHGRWITDETIRVPLFFWGHNGDEVIPSRGKQKGMARGVDLPPTIAALAGVEWPGALPSTAGPKVVERGIEASGKGLEISGRSFADWIMSGTPAARRSALTVTTQNAYQPRDYPSEGRRYWRTLALRNERSWVLWDGVEQEVEVRDLDASRPTSLESLEQAKELLETEHGRAVDSGPLIPEELLADSNEGMAEEDLVAARLRTLGYLE